VQGRPFSLFASFFRIISGYDKETKIPKYAHSLTWAILDVERQKYYADSLVDPDAPRLGKERLERGEGTRDHRLRRALEEVLNQNTVPRPDRVMAAEAKVSLDKLELDYDGNTYTKLEDGLYHLHLHNDEWKGGCDLNVRLLKEPVRHGDNGVVKGTAGEDMFYYFIPRCEVTGTLTVEGETFPIEQASGWYDHEFGAPQKEEADAAEASAETQETEQDGETSSHLHKSHVAWNWASVQFEDGSELTAYDLIDMNTDERLGNYCVFIPKEGGYQTVREFTLTPLQDDMWCSTRTFHQYPTQWVLEVPAFEISLELKAAFDDQEFITLISKPAFWEGRIHAKGTKAGQPAQGIGFVERSGFEGIEDLDGFFTAVGKETRKSLRAVMPLEPRYDVYRDLIASEKFEHFMEGVDLEQFSQTMVKPVREITDRGGKSWRSYAAVACCDVVGGDSRQFVQWLAMPELMHVGSLIIDDVQDKSDWRRGGKTTHLIYGEPLAINAGTACYFMGQKLLLQKSLPPEDQLKIYDLYFQALRAGHAGQALDIDGMNHLMPDVVESGDIKQVEKRVLAIHRLKTASPAGTLARMGGVAGKGTQEQIDALGYFFESVGLAFQIIDDVLNLRGFQRNLKSKGEDIKHGKVTMPVVKAMTRLELKDRRWLWDTVDSKPQDDEVVGQCIALIEECGALDACVEQASALVEEAWQVLDPLVEHSLQKLMLRAFGWYVLERHY
jgi:geranylgeranyl pyrophosphate synthase/predicted secreted hydrolase